MRKEIPVALELGETRALKGSILYLFLFEGTREATTEDQVPEFQELIDFPLLLL